MPTPSHRFFAAALLSFAACQKPSVSPGSASSVNVDFRHNPTGKGTHAATFGNDSITAEELSQRFAQMAPPVRARYQTADERRTFLDNLARFELLAQEAAREGLANDPDVIADAKRLMMNKLLETKLTARIAPPSDADLAGYYRLHVGDYVRPEQLRLSLVFISAPPALQAAPGDKKARVSKEKEAQALHAAAEKMGPVDFVAFGKLAREHSEDVRSQVLNGDTTLLPVADLERLYGPEVVTAAKALQRPGELSPLVATEKGFYFLKLGSRMPAVDRKAADPDVRSQMTSRISFERRTQALELYVQELKTAAHYTVDDAAVAAIKVDPSAPTAMSQSRTPMKFLPPGGRSRVTPAGAP